MKIKTTVSREYRLGDADIAEFRARVLQHLNSLDEGRKFTLDDISVESVENFLNESLPSIIEEMLDGEYYPNGIELDSCGFYRTVSFDFHGEDVRDLIVDMADTVLEEVSVC